MSIIKPNLESWEREAYEQYLLAADEEQRQEALNRFVPGSDAYNFLYLINQQNLRGANLDKKDQALFEQMQKDNSKGCKELKYRAEFLAFDQQDKQKALSEISKMVGKPSKQNKPYNQELQEANEEESKVSNEKQLKKATLPHNHFVMDHAKQLYDKQAKKKWDNKNFQGAIDLLEDMPTWLYHQLDFSKFPSRAVYQFACNIAEAGAIAGINNLSLFKSIRDALSIIAKEHEYDCDETLCENMTIEQLQIVMKGSKDPNLSGAHFKKQFSYELSSENQEIWTKEEKHRNLKHLLGGAVSAGLPKSLRMMIQQQILILGPEIGEYNKELFKQTLEYEESRLTGNSVMQSIKNAIKKPLSELHEDFDWHPYVGTVITHKPFWNTIESYLTHFAFANKGNLSEFKHKNHRYLDNSYIEDIEDKVSVYLSEDGIKSIQKNSRITAALFKAIENQVSLSFLPENKEKFSISELVELHLEIKNVQTVHCKVFEFNTETYYRKNLKPFGGDMDLDGLESTIAKTFQCNYPKNYKKRQSFQFEELNNRQGLFIIEFVGNGRSARAVIKKGSLSLIHQSTVGGHLVYILDDYKKICREDTGLWMDKKFYGADAEKGSIFIPYGQSEQSKKVIMKYGSFHQLGDFYHKTESYSFDCKFFVNEESILVGANASVVVRPQLMINGRKAQTSLLQNSKIVLTTYNYIDNTPVTKTFDDIKFQDNTEHIIDFQVPPNLDNIEVQLTTKVRNSTTKDLQDFRASDTFEITSRNSADQICELYLKMAADETYELLCLGKNGEPRQKMRFNLGFTHSFVSNVKSHELHTDENGKMYLGKLENVKKVSATGIDQFISQFWNLQQINHDQWQFNESVNMAEGQSFEIPVAKMWDSKKPNELMRQQVTLFRSKDGVVIDDWFPKIKVSREAHYYLLKVDNLEEGNYVLNIRGHNPVNFDIKVHKGTKWNDLDNFILKNNMITEIVQSHKMIKIKNSSLENKSSTLQVQLQDFSKNARCHLIATKFVHSETKHFATEMQEIVENQILGSQFPFASWTNMLMSNRLLGDEFRYVFDRAHAERSLGNTLDRPSLLMKRLFTRKTEMDQEVLASGGEYQKKSEKMAAPGGRMNRGYGGGRGGGGGGGGRGRGGYSGKCHGSLQAPSGGPNYITEFQNFLKDSPLVEYNLKPDETGLISYTNAKLLNYSTLKLVVVDKDSVVQSIRDIDFNQENLAKRDLTLKKALDQNKGLTERRQTTSLFKGDKDHIEDITSSEIQIIDDLKKVNQILGEIRKLDGAESSEWAKLNFVMTWSSLDQSNKERLWSEYFSHELNFFIKKRDPAFFERSVRGFLANKMQKSLVDHYLLDNLEEVRRHHSGAKFVLLNSLEKCFVVDSLARSVDPAQKVRAEQITRSMEDQRSILEDTSSDKKRTNQIFDLLLNSNSLSKNSTKIEEKEGRARKSNLVQFSAMRVMPPGAPSCGPAIGKGRGKAVDPFTDNSINDLVMNGRDQHMKLEKFSELEITSEYKETYYYNNKTGVRGSRSDYENSCPMWSDYARFLVNKEQNGFLSPNFTTIKSHETAFIALCILDMPFETVSSTHSLLPDDSRGLHITAGCNSILFKKEIKEVVVNLKQDFMVTHRYHREDDYGKQTRSDDDDAIPDEFIVNTPYRCEVIMTNVSPEKKEFDLLYQIPLGSMPMKKTKYMKSDPFSLQPYSTNKTNFYFYFPNVGQQSHYPSNVSIDEKVIARGEINQLNVVKKRNIKKEGITNFNDLVQIGTPEEILEYLRTQNLFVVNKGFEFSKILWLCEDKIFWQQCIQILRERQIYQESVWRYAFKHECDIQAVKEYLNTSKPGCVLQLGPFFESSLISVTPQFRCNYFEKMLEYYPMINSRAHKLGEAGTHKILNKTFRQTYGQFLQSMAYKKSFDFANKMIFVYYLQLQDRNQEAIKLFQSLERPAPMEWSAFDEAEVDTLTLQYDYFSAYFDFFTGAEDGYKIARRIAMKYDNYPVSHWRLMFLAIQEQLFEIDGEFDDNFEDSDSGQMQGVVLSDDASLLMAEKKKENMKNSKLIEPLMAQTEMDEQGSITIESVNIKEVTLKYYIIDAEILFSRAPFLKNSTEEFSYVKPFLQHTEKMVAADADKETLATYVTKVIGLPEAIKTKNLVVEISGGYQTVFKTYYSCSMKVNIVESFGELKVIDKKTSKALPSIYVKVFSREKNGKETFFRDGYTDIRGKFEYATTSGDKLKNVSKFSILIESKEHGSQIREVDPPVDAQTSEPGQLGSLQQRKMERCVNRNNYVQQRQQQ